MYKTTLALIAAGVVATAATPASASGLMTCDAPRAKWKPVDRLTAKLGAQGWKVRKAEVDGGCYEVYGTTPEGDRVEAYFHPVSFEKLLVTRRGETLFRKK